jgi:hypothetical protein
LKREIPHEKTFKNKDLRSALKVMPELWRLRRARLRGRNGRSTGAAPIKDANAAIFAIA